MVCSLYSVYMEKFNLNLRYIRQILLYGIVLVCFLAITVVVAKAEIINVDNKKIYVTQNDLHCLAENMYWEARNQSKAAMLAVSHVVINRVFDQRFPNKICEVIKQGPTRKSWKNDSRIPIKNRCQFSWWCDGKSDIPPKVDRQLWHETKILAQQFVFNYRWILDPTDGATFYHAYYVKPGWAKQKKRTARIESHIFYKWKK